MLDLIIERTEKQASLLQNPGPCLGRGGPIRGKLHRDSDPGRIPIREKCMFHSYTARLLLRNPLCVGLGMLLRRHNFGSMNEPNADPGGSESPALDFR